MLRSLIPFRLPLRDLVLIYTGYIRPLVEYAVPVWHPGLTVYQTNQIEGIQKRALRLILGSQYISYDQALLATQLESLADRRERLCLRFAQSLTKSLHFREWLPLRPKHPDSRALRKRSTYQPIRCRTDRYKQSPIPFFISILNKQ